MWHMTSGGGSALPQALAARRMYTTSYQPEKNQPMHLHYKYNDLDKIILFFYNSSSSYYINAISILFLKVFI